MNPSLLVSTWVLLPIVPVPTGGGHVGHRVLSEPLQTKMSAPIHPLPPRSPLAPPLPPGARPTTLMGTAGEEGGRLGGGDGGRGWRKSGRFCQYLGEAAAVLCAGAGGAAMGAGSQGRGEGGEGELGERGGGKRSGGGQWGGAEGQRGGGR
ncbi:unnamed protein product [Closterium sp. NIES-65]|nr:unnamed protein product [Closterium sp. NIES-65]